jgi:hypothetical protein
MTSVRQILAEPPRRFKIVELSELSRRSKRGQFQERLHGRIVCAWRRFWFIPDGWGLPSLIVHTDPRKERKF